MRIAVADASPAVVHVVARVLGSVPGWEVAWTARSARDTISRCATAVPDVLLIGTSLPHADVVDATRQASASGRCAVLLLTHGGGDAVTTVFRALGAGALDRAAAPSVGPDGRLLGGDELVRKIRTAARAIGVGSGRARAAARATPGALPVLVVLGASTGGPAAVLAVLRAFPSDLAAAVLVVQHVDARFTGNLAEWLDKEVALPVGVARDGDVPAPSRVTIAGRDEDLVLRPDLTLGYERPVPGAFVHPSVDVFFRSVAEHWPGRGVAALLTGMGRDGAEGLLALRRREWRTFAQDEGTSVVYGMPKAAVTLDAASDILPIDLIGPAILQAVAAAGDERGARE